jgi:hypothetical protein
VGTSIGAGTVRTIGVSVSVSATTTATATSTTVAAATGAGVRALVGSSCRKYMVSSLDTIRTHCYNTVLIHGRYRFVLFLYHFLFSQ